MLVGLSILHMACRMCIVLTIPTQGPAHAVYFATYEAVKHLMGGNKAGEHHPLAAGKASPVGIGLRQACPAGLLTSHCC